MIKCLAIDDEPLALKQLAAYLKKVPFFHLVESCQSALDAMSILGSVEIDVIFLDINMPDLNGLDFVRSLNHPPMVVFTTAYQEYAVEGFKVDAIDYLLKPFGMGDVIRAADKVKRQYELLHTECLSPLGEDDVMFLKTEYKVVRILTHDILYVEGMAEYLRIHLATSDRNSSLQTKSLTVLFGMKKMDERLTDRDFMRIHKSYIVNLHRISEIQRSRVVLEDGKEIPIGDSYRDKLNEYVSKKFL